MGHPLPTDLDGLQAAASTVWALARTRPVRAAALLYPPAVVAETIATGDHIWLDSLGGLVVAGLGFASARATHMVRHGPTVDTGCL